MYKRTIWQDHVEGIQEGTDMNAANFNNLEAGTMEATALAALEAAYRRYASDDAENAKTVIIKQTLTGSSLQSVDIPTTATRNTTNYGVGVEIENFNGGTCGDIIINTKQANGFKAKYNGSASSVSVIFKVSGGMF